MFDNEKCSKLLITFTLILREQLYPLFFNLKKRNNLLDICKYLHFSNIILIMMRPNLLEIFNEI